MQGLFSSGKTSPLPELVPAITRKIGLTRHPKYPFASWRKLGYSACMTLIWVFLQDKFFIVAFQVLYLLWFICRIRNAS